MTKDTFEIKIGEKPIIIKTTNWAEQASGSCLVQMGETEVLATVVMSPFEREGFKGDLRNQEPRNSRRKILHG